MFPIISSEIQKAFEQQQGNPEKIPCICGYYGRACYQLNKAEGANRVLCFGCPLKEFASRTPSA